MTDRDKADLLNQLFQSVFTQEDAGPLPDSQHTAPVPDGIPASILAKAADELAKPFTLLFRQSLDSGQIPEDWKTALVTPIFKKGSKTTPSNYRPVSLTCIACKVMEKMLKERVMDHLQRNQLISEEQHGFVPGRSTITQLLEVMDTWRGECRCSLHQYMHYQKAFDSVPHRRLLGKVRAHGVGGKVLGWIQDFLKERRQKVVINGIHSQDADVTSGIPQGNVLGPLLFVMFINDLPRVVKSEVKIFADDTKLYGRSDTAQGIQNMQDDPDQLQMWSDQWLLRFHPQKCAVMKLGTTKSEATYSMCQLKRMEAPKN
ncbi:hypothetical protein ACOMHN_028011 [Nucella lapillus]